MRRKGFVFWFYRRGRRNVGEESKKERRERDRFFVEREVGGRRRSRRKWVWLEVDVGMGAMSNNFVSRY